MSMSDWWYEKQYAILNSFRITRGLSYLAAVFADFVRLTKIPERRAFGYFLIDSCLELRLADGVDVAGEVEHLVGEAPLVKGDAPRLPCSLRSPAPGCFNGLPQYPCFILFWQHFLFLYRYMNKGENPFRN